MKNILNSGLFRFVYMLFNFATGIIIAKIGGTEVFGTISLMVVNAAVVHIITGLGTDSAIVWHGANNNKRLNQLLTFTLGSGFLQLLIFVFLSVFWFVFYQRTFLTASGSPAILYLELLYFFGFVWLEKYISVLYANQMSTACNRILAAVTLFIFLLILPSVSGYSFFSIKPFTFYCFLPIMQAVPLVIYFHGKINIRLAFLTRIEMKSFISFSVIVFITNTLQFLAYRVDYWLIAVFRDTAQLGIYAQANRFAQLLWVVPNILAGLLIPVLASPDKNLSKYSFPLFVRVLIYSGLFIMAAIILISYVLYSSFLPPDYSDGFRSLLLMLPGYYFFVTTIILAAWFAARRLLWVNFWCSSLCLAVIFISDLILIPRYGINGAAISNTIGYSASAIFSVIAFSRYSGYASGELFLIQKNDFRKLITYRFSGK